LCTAISPFSLLFFLSELLSYIYWTFLYCPLWFLILILYFFISILLY
jgi:hypothetical protein